MNGKFKIVKKYVDEYDYYGLLRDGAPDDEFISEALRISDRISEDNTIEQIAAIIADVFHLAFGNEENTRNTIYRLLKRYGQNCIPQHSLNPANQS